MILWAMANNVLALSVKAPTEVRFSGSDLVKLWRLESHGNQLIFRTYANLHDPRDHALQLDEGLYAVVSRPGARLGIEGGLVLLPFGGEDPWPVPPSQQQAERQSRVAISVAFRDFERVPLVAER